MAKKKKNKKNAQLTRGEEEKVQQEEGLSTRSLRPRRRLDYAESSDNELKPNKSVTHREVDEDYDPPTTKRKKGKQPQIKQEPEPPAPESRKAKSRGSTRRKKSREVEEPVSPPPESEDDTDDENDEDFEYSGTSSSEPVTDDEVTDDELSENEVPDDVDPMDLDKDEFGEIAGWEQPQASKRSKTKTKKSGAAKKSRKTPEDSKGTPETSKGKPKNSKGTPENSKETPEKPPPRWGLASQKDRQAHPPRVTPPSSGRVAGWNHILLRYDPDKGLKSAPIKGKIRYIVSRGYLLVGLPSLNPNHGDLERGVLVKGREYTEAKQRFIDGGGQTVKSKPSSFLDDSTWMDFHIICVATPADQSMTIIEGYVDKEGRGDLGLISMTNVKAHYGGPEADALVLDSRVRVGQERLSRKKPRLPAEVMEFLAQRRLHL